MDRIVIDQKLESLRRCLARIRTKLPLTSDTFKTDFDVQDIISMNLTRAVQMAVDIGAHIVSSQQQVTPTSMCETFEQLGQSGVISSDLAVQLKKSVGFRNIAVHNYSTINWDIVQSIVQEHLQDFDAFGKAIVHYLQDH
jgi:uncharacterized protein YutE (UPF0331/DUF86 family)